MHRRSIPWSPPSPQQTPQSARREDEGEAPEPAERPEGPDEEKAAGGLGDLAVMCPPHVDDGHGCREEPDEQHDDVPRSPFGEHERPVQEDREDEQRSLRGLGLRYPTDDVVRHVQRQQEDREQRRDDQDCVVLHSILPGSPTCAPTEWRHAYARTTSLRRRADSGGRTAAPGRRSLGEGGYICRNRCT